MDINGQSYDLLRLIYLAARTQQIDPALVAGFVSKESAFNAAAQGDYEDGAPWAFGLMQLNVRYGPATVRAYMNRPTELFDPALNLRLGCEYLRACLDAFPDDIQSGICAYNAGIGRVRADGWLWNQDRYVLPVLASRAAWRAPMAQVAILAHVDAVWGHLDEARNELIALKQAAGLD